MPQYRNPYYQGGRSGYQGGGRTVGTFDIPNDPIADNPGLQAMETYRVAKENRKAREMEKAQYATKMAELAGGYTPELEAQALAPLAEEPSVTDRFAGGLGRMFGSDTQRGLTEPVNVPGGLKTGYERSMEKEQREREMTDRDYTLGRKETASQTREGTYGIKKRGYVEGLDEKPADRRTAEFTDAEKREKKLVIPREQRTESRQIEKEKRSLLSELNKEIRDEQREYDKDLREERQWESRTDYTEGVNIEREKRLERINRGNEKREYRRKIQGELRSEGREINKEERANQTWYDRQDFLNKFDLKRMGKQAEVERATKKYLQDQGLNSSKKGMTEVEKSQLATTILNEYIELQNQAIQKSKDDAVVDWGRDKEPAEPVMHQGLASSFENELRKLGYAPDVMEDGSIGLKKTDAIGIR